ncbi:MAG: hypothetical protein IKJ17_03290 [Clostridia bacterium]|nr:hypothetical protein [Clostridia bacterium]
MDRYLFDKFVFEMDDELYGNSCIAFAKMAKSIVNKPNQEKVTFNYYPHEEEDLQLVVEGVMHNNSVQIGSMKMHHTSEDVWKLKIVTAIDECDGSYLVTRPDGNGLVAVRLVNEQVLDTVEKDNVIEAQVVAFAVDVNIYENDTAYAESITPSADGKKLLLKDGLVIATDYLVNNSAHLTKEERQNREHCFDNLVDICGTITTCNKLSLNMLGMDLNNYYWANVMTDFGQLKIIIARSLLPKDIEGFGEGNVIVGKVMLSGDVCIYDYDKYISPLNPN